MDDFTGLLVRDFGLKPQGKSAPMAPQSNSPASDFNSFASSYSFANASSSPSRKKSDSSPVFDDPGRDGDDLLFNDVFSRPPKYGSSDSPAPAFDYDAMFKERSVPKPASSSMPVYDKPVFDEDVYDEAIPELKIPSTSQSARFDNVFASPSKHRKQNSSPLDDLMGNLGKANKTENEPEEKGSSVFDDLIPGFGRSSSPSTKRPTSEMNEAQKPSYRTSSNLVEDPFVVLEESASAPREPSTGGFTDPLEEIGKFNSRKTHHSSVRGGVFVDIDPLDSLGKSGTDMSSRDKSHLRPGSTNGSQSPVESSRSYHSKKVSFDEVLEPQNTSSKTQTASPVYEDPLPPLYRENLSENKSHNSHGSFESSDDVWLTVSEIPLFTQPTSAPPPNRPPPPRPTRPIKKKVNEPSLSSSTNHSHLRSSTARASVNSPRASHIDEHDDFYLGRNQTAANGHSEPPSGEDSDVFSAAVASAAAMKDAMDKAELKFRHAKEMREKENLKASRSKEGVHLDDSRERELREKQVRLDRERVEREEMEKAQEREREEREREQKRNEKERERLLARQAVERATREARERAATEAHAKVQRAAVGKATDARERAERAAVQRAHAEARERAAAGAREKAEKAAAEARERANAEAREKEARVRAERAAVERAAAEARGRAAAQAKAKQQENNNDLDSFFSSVNRPSSAPRQRTNPADPFQDSWNKGGSFESSKASSRVPSGAPENLRKASSSTNIVDDLSSIFGGGGSAAAQFGGFPDVEGETEERRRARLERHQRTQERAAKALAEKNERDLQVQRDQAERNRIGETLDVEIKRWGAGKEGNLRALLSTLQYVLWPECGWQPVSLTDLITGASVKKVYRKATLCIHPDKVQQKGANLQQKYIAEKVFDMLKEAWNKFNSEELF